MKKVLLFIDYYNSGGIENIIESINNNLKKEYQITILSFVNVSKNSEVKSLLSKSDRNFFVRNILGLKKLKKFLYNNKYDIVHINCYNSFGLVYAKLFKKYANKVIVHAHNSGIDNDIFKVKALINRIIKKVYPKTYTLIGCSKEANLFCFGKEGTVIHNGVEYKKFYPSLNDRKKYRKQYNIEDKIVIGSIGRFTKQKNQSFTIKVFNQLLKESGKYFLILIGEGENLKKVKSLVKELHIEDNVLFLNNRKDIDRLINAFDIYVQPSIYEGFGLSIVENQINDKIVFISDKVSKDIIITNNIHRLELNEEIWFKIIKNAKHQKQVLSDKLEFKNFILKIKSLYDEERPKKVLFIANSDRHIKLCHIPYLKMFKDNGYIVHVATNSSNKIDYCNKKTYIRLKRNPFSFLNFFALFQVRKLVKKEEYNLISCHTPIGGFLGRCSIIRTSLNTKVVYTAHGFHFYKKSPIINWLIYYPVEKYLSKYTDLIVTMNKEDYLLAKDKFKCNCIKINGIGLDTKRLALSNKNLRKELKLEKKFVVSYIAEISNRKNHPQLLRTLKKYDLEKENIVFLLVGDSRLKNFNRKVKKDKNVIYINFKNNVGDYINMSDALIFPSKQEGLPQSVLEALYFNKMIFTFDIRGCNDIIKNNINGKLIPSNDMKRLIDEVIKYKNKKNKESINNNIEMYKIEKILKEIKRAYNKYLGINLK